MIGARSELVRFERRSDASDGYGNVEAAWATVLTTWAKVTPKPAGGDETVQQGRLAGAAPYTIMIESFSASRQLVVGDRAVIVHDGALPAGTALNIRFIGDMDGRRAVLTMDAERGVAT